MKYIIVLFLMVNLYAGVLSQNTQGVSTVQIKQKAFKEAKALFDKHKYKEAYAAFHALFLQDLQDPNINFYLGRSAYELHKYEKAIAAYERVLMADESSLRAKLEMAKCYYALQEYVKAKALFFEIVKYNLPVVVRQNIQMYLNAIESKTQRSFYNGSVVVGINYDTNIYNRATDDIFTLPGIIDGGTNQPIKVSNATDDKSGYAHQEVISFNHSYKINENVFIRNNVMAFSKIYFGAHDMNTQLLQYMPSLSVVYNHRVFVDYRLLYDHVWLGNNSFLTHYGLYPKLTYIYSPRMIVTTTAEYQRKKNKKDEYKQRDSRIFSLELNLDYIYSDAVLASLYSQYTWERKMQGELTNVDYNMGTAAFSFVYKHSPAWNVAPKVQWYHKQYKEKDPFYLRYQEDDEYQFSLTSTYSWRKNLLFNASYIYTNYNSNVAAWKFDKQSVSGNIVYLF